jgi:hypothetical protein
MTRILVTLKNRTRNYLLSQGRAIWEIMQKAYVILTMLDNATQGERQRYENNYKSLNLTTTSLGTNVYDRVADLEIAHDVWLKLSNTYDGSSEIKSSPRDTYCGPLSVAYVLVVHLLILIMNVLNSYCVLLMILFGV